MYPIVEEDETFAGITATLSAAYVKKANNVYARHLLVSRRQQTGGSVTEYAQAFKKFGKRMPIYCCHGKWISRGTD